MIVPVLGVIISGVLVPEGPCVSSLLESRVTSKVVLRCKRFHIHLYACRHPGTTTSFCSLCGSTFSAEQSNVYNMNTHGWKLFTYHQPNKDQLCTDDWLEQTTFYSVTDPPTHKSCVALLRASWWLLLCCLMIWFMECELQASGLSQWGDTAFVSGCTVHTFWCGHIKPESRMVWLSPQENGLGKRRYRNRAPKPSSYLCRGR